MQDILTVSHSLSTVAATENAQLNALPTSGASGMNKWRNRWMKEPRSQQPDPPIMAGQPPWRYNKAAAEP